MWLSAGKPGCQKRRRKRTGQSTILDVTAVKANDVWSIDFQFDSTVTGKVVKILSIVDEHTRNCLTGMVDDSTAGDNPVMVLDLLDFERGMPGVIRMDIGPEFISRALASWASKTELVFLPPGQPWRNGFVESFNGKLRDECVDVYQFHSLDYGGGVIGLWKEEYNTIRPHSSLGYLTPSAHAGQYNH